MKTPLFFARRYFSAGLSRLGRNTLTALYRPESGWSPPPVLVALRPTEDCNLHCRTCFNFGDDVVGECWPAEIPESELPEPDYLKLIGELAGFNPSFYISGGEPLLSPKLLPALAAIKERGKYVSLNTNGTLLAGKARELVGSGLDKIIVSLDGPPEVHDSVRGRTFQAIAEGVAAVRREKDRQGRRTPLLRAQCVISPANLDRLHETVAAARRVGLEEIRFQHLSFAFSRADMSLDGFFRSAAVRARISNILLPPGGVDVNELRKQMTRIRGDKIARRRSGYEPDIRREDLSGYYGDPEYPFTDSCLSPWRRLVVSPGGGMGPCPGIYLGTYPETTPVRVWRGPAFRAFRRRIIRQGLFRHCRRCCHREYYPVGLGLAVH